MTKLGDIIDTKSGKAIRNVSNFGKYPVYGSNGIIGYSDDYQNERAVIIGRVGAYCGSIYLCDAKFWPSDNTIIAKPKTDNNLYFINYLLKNLKLNNLAGGSAQPLLTQGVIKSFEIDKIFSENVQQKIASILSAYDDLIENNNNRIKILEEISDSVYKEFFVTNKNPDWKLTSIKDITVNLDNKRKPLSSMQRMKRQGFIPYYGAAKVIDYIDDFLLDGRYLLVAEDGTVITKDGYPVLQLTNGKFWVSNHAHIIQGKGNFSLEYIYLFLSNYKIISHITGSAQPKLSQQNFNRIQIANPDETTMLNFNNIVKPIMNEIMVLESKNEVLKKTKNLLLPKLISGELDVEGLDIKIRPEIL